MLELCHTPKELSIWYNEQLTEELAGDLPLDDLNVPSAVDSNKTKTIIQPSVQQKEKTRLEKRNAILEVIKEKGFNALSIPHGGVSAIPTSCRVRYGKLLDTPSEYGIAA